MIRTREARHPRAGGDPASQQKATRLPVRRIPACAGMTMLLLLAMTTAHADTQTAVPQPSIALHGDPKYPANFTHFDYTNPDALKGGVLRLHDVGTFDSLNPFIVKGESAAGLNATGSGLLYESLMDQSADEPFTMYGVLAESIEVAPDHSWVAFNLRPDARWSDGQKVTADDVVWSFNTEVNKGWPYYKTYYNDVAKVEATGERRVMFTLRNKDNFELPLILAQLTILPKHYWDSENHNIGDTTLDPPIGSGPYKIGTISPGRSIEYVRDPKWWGKNLPINRGRWNFDRVTFDYYKDDNVSLEAFFAGQYDVREERSAKMWATAYDAPAVKDGRIKKEDIPNQTPAGMQAYVYNIRKPVFQDRAVRQALAYAFDFDWSNKQFAYGAYTRSRSYFSNSELESHNTPDGKELELLNKFKGRVPDELFTAEYNPPSTDGSGDNRENLRQAIKILEAAGWQIDPSDGIRKEREDGPAPHLRNHHRRSALRTLDAPVHPEPATHRRAGDLSHHRLRAVRKPRQEFRLRHDHRHVRRVQLTRQRTDRLLGQRDIRRDRFPQPDRRARSCRRRTHQHNHPRAKPRRPRRRHSCA